MQLGTGICLFLFKLITSGKNVIRAKARQFKTAVKAKRMLVAVWYLLSAMSRLLSRTPLRHVFGGNALTIQAITVSAKESQITMFICIVFLIPLLTLRVEGIGGRYLDSCLEINTNYREEFLIHSLDHMLFKSAQNYTLFSLLTAV